MPTLRRCVPLVGLDGVLGPGLIVLLAAPGVDHIPLAPLAPGEHLLEATLEAEAAQHRLGGVAAILVLDQLGRPRLAQVAHQVRPDGPLGVLALVFNANADAVDARPKRLGLRDQGAINVAGDADGAMSPQPTRPPNLLAHSDRVELVEAEHVAQPGDERVDGFDLGRGHVQIVGRSVDREHLAVAIEDRAAVGGQDLAAHEVARGRLLQRVPFDELQVGEAQQQPGEHQDHHQDQPADPVLIPDG